VKGVGKEVGTYPGPYQFTTEHDLEYHVGAGEPWGGDFKERVFWPMCHRKVELTGNKRKKAPTTRSQESSPSIGANALNRQGVGFFRGNSQGRLEKLVFALQRRKRTRSEG